MADDLDLHAMLEAPYSKKEGESKSSGKENGTSDSSKSKSRRSRSRSKSRRRRSRSRSKSRRERRHRSRSKSRDRRRSRSKDRRRSKSRDRRRRSRSPHQHQEKKRSGPHLTPEERDARTVFCMQLSRQIRASDLEEFFSSVGEVTDVRLIMCNKTRRFKGIVYVEFKAVESVALAIALTGQKLLGVPIMVQASQAEKNRAAQAAAASGNAAQARPNIAGSMRLYVGSLHFNITEDMVRSIFEPFGKIDDVQLIMDPATQRSRGYGFLTFRHSEDAMRAMEKLNGFELAGRPMKVGHVAERSDASAGAPTILDTDEMDRSGIELGATGRYQLMAKLAEGTGMSLPQNVASVLGPTGVMGGIGGQGQMVPPIATQCFMLANMFDPTTAVQQPSFDVEIRDDVIEECNKHGGLTHIYVDKASPQGNVYVKCPSIAAAAASVNALHGRWFAGKVITAAYVPLLNYHSLFPDAMTATALLLPQRAQRAA